MENTAKPRSVSLGWKMAILTPLAVSFALQLLASRQSDLHAQILRSTLGSMFLMVSLITLSIHWIVVRKLTGWGIAMLIFSSAVLGFGVHTLLRAM